MRPCEVCSKSQRRKKVQAKFGKRVICLSCGAKWMFDDAGEVVPRQPSALELAFRYNAMRHTRDTDHRQRTVGQPAEPSALT